MLNSYTNCPYIYITVQHFGNEARPTYKSVGCTDTSTQFIDSGGYHPPNKKGIHFSSRLESGIFFHASIFQKSGKQKD